MIRSHTIRKRKDHKSSDDNVGWIDPIPAPTLNHLGLAAKKLTGLKAILFDDERYKNIREENPRVTPDEHLKEYLIVRDTPCIVRTPSHNIVAVGINLTSESYIFNIPANSYEETKTKERFEREWKDQEPKDGYPGDTKNLMLVIFNPKGNRTRREPRIEFPLL